ncbi:hypothetical protein Bbelb_142420 [Branchiostoma belcheri]|nr:hypothetical protein Bbelb_142420 [Branchiostoma belcheri]
MDVEASKQKMAWQEIENRVEEVVCCITNLEETVGEVQLNDLLQDAEDVGSCFKDVLETSAELETEMGQFEKQAIQVWENVRRLSLMKDHDTVLAEPEEPEDAERPFQDLADQVFKLVNNSCDGHRNQMARLAEDRQQWKTFAKHHAVPMAD